MVQLIKKIAVEAVQASKPCSIMVGKVLKTNPIEIQVKQNMILDDTFLQIPKRLKKELNKGDKVALIRQDGGQLFYILDQL